MFRKYNNMKVTVTTLTGEKFELDVKPEDSVKQVKRGLYKTGKVSSQVRLLQGQTALHDDGKLSEYNIIQDGAVISALFEPDVDINIEVSTGHKTCQFVVPNSTSIMALKVQLFDIMKSGFATKDIGIGFEDIELENDMPLHYYAIQNGSKLRVIRPYITATIEDNHGEVLYTRINRKDQIKDVKIMLSKEKHIDAGNGQSVGSEENMRFYHVDDDDNYHEMADNLTVNDYKIEDNAKLYLLSYRWTSKQAVVKILGTGRKLEGVEQNDTLLSVKVRAQDQLGVPVREVKFAWFDDLTSCTEADAVKVSNVQNKNLVVGTEEDIKAETERREEKRRAEEEEQRRAEEAKKQEQEEQLDAEIARRAAQEGTPVQQFFYGFNE